MSHFSLVSSCFSEPSLASISVSPEWRRPNGSELTEKQYHDSKVHLSLKVKFLGSGRGVSVCLYPRNVFYLRISSRLS